MTRPLLAILILAVAELLLGELAALLCFDAKRRDRARFEPTQADLVAGLFAIPVAALVDAAQRGIDLLEQLALTIARTQLEPEFRSEERRVGKECKSC